MCVCAAVCVHSTVTYHILLTLTNHIGLNITLTLWHNITPRADSRRSFACVLLLRGPPLFVFKEDGEQRLGCVCVREISFFSPLFFTFFERVCLCSLFSDTSSVRADLLPTSHPHPAVTSPLFTAAAKGLYKQLNVRAAT